MSPHSQHPHHTKEVISILIQEKKVLSLQLTPREILNQVNRLLAATAAAVGIEINE
jgi:phosphopentomutase